MDFFDKHYHTISQIYINYINSDEYNNHPVTEYTTSISNNTINEIVDKCNELCTCDKFKFENAISDKILTGEADHEQAGFILGFAYALTLITESNLKELKGSI